MTMERRRLTLSAAATALVLAILVSLAVFLAKRGSNDVNENDSLRSSNVIQAEDTFNDLSSSYVCSVTPLDGSVVEIDQWNSDSGWRSLTDDTSQVCAVMIIVAENEDAAPGNELHILNNWSQPSILSGNVDTNSFIMIPENTVGSLQFYVEHATGSPYQANVMLCNLCEIVSPPTLPPVTVPPPVTTAPSPTPTQPTVPTPTEPSTPTAPTGDGYVCSAEPISGSSLSVAQFNDNSGWRELAQEASAFCAVQVQGINTGGTTGNMLHVISSWSLPSIVNGPADSDVIVDIPTGTMGTLQYFIEHSTGGAYEASILLCTQCPSESPPPPTPPPVASPPMGTPAPVQGPPITPSCSSGTLDSFNLPQRCRPDQLGLETDSSFGKWRPKSLITGVSNTGEDCRDLHDRYFVVADNGKAYHSWHPAVADGCKFAHEHGDDSKESNVFSYSEGYPPFGYAADLYRDREEDHFGHKITVANNLRMAIGAVQDGDVVYDSGIICNWHSKLHQGSFSADAITNNLHEYFLNVECDDTQFGDNTRFSVKAMVEWGLPNTFDVVTARVFRDVANEGRSELLNPWDDQPDPIRTNFTVSPFALPQGSHGGGRGADFPGIQWKTWTPPSDIIEPELWSGPSGGSLLIPGNGTIDFAPYYIVKNMARVPLADGSDGFVVKRTVDACYDDSGRRVGGGFCDPLPLNYPGPEYYKSEDSLFKGTVRALNFKNLELLNENGPLEFCTDVFGKTPSDLPCNVGQIRQKASAISNYWKSQAEIPPPPCIKDINGVCHQPLNLLGTLSRFEFGYENGEWVATPVGAIREPNFGSAAYRGAGIGYEWIMNHGNAEGIRLPN